MRRGRALRQIPRAARPKRLTETGAISTAAAGLDVAFLAVVVIVSLVLYVGSLGFYYDDYSVLARMHFAPDHSLFGLYDAVRPATGQRPLQALTFATLYWLFGQSPLGYHVTNAVILIAVAALLYLVLRELRLPRVVCVVLPLVYSTIPHYATNRFWLDAFQINLSSAFFLTSVYAALRCLRASRAGFAFWLPIAVVCVGASLLAYEVVFPLFALAIVLIWWASRRPGAARSKAAFPVTAAVLAAAVIGFGLAKAALVAQHGQNSYQLGLGDDFLHHVGYLVSGAVKVDIGTYFLAFPYVLWWIVRHRFSAGAAAIALAAGAMAFAYVWAIGRRSREAFATGAVWRAVVLAGIAAFVLGYAVFLTNQNILFRSAGIDNRVNAASALGLAAVFAGGVGWALGRVRPGLREALFAAITALTIACGVFVVDTLGSFWTSAAREQRAIVNDVVTRTGAERSWRILLLDGACPENGPAVVFADQWDLRGALQVHYDDHSIAADVAAEGLAATGHGIRLQMTFLGHVSTRTYPYGRDLAVFDTRSRRLYTLSDRAAAERYLARDRPAFRCPPQRDFAWGFDPGRRRSLL